MSEIAHYSEQQSDYTDILRTVRRGNVLSPEINDEWSSEALAAILEESIGQAAEQCLTDNQGELHTTLSGGLDSTYCLAVLRKKYPGRKIVTYTLGAKENHPDIKYSRIAAQTYQTKHYEFLLEGLGPDKIHEYVEDFRRLNPATDMKEAAQAGDIDVYVLYRLIAETSGGKTLIVHDGIDEQLGGYWEHRKEQSAESQANSFRDLWSKLEDEHLMPLIRTTSSLEIKILFPYLDSRLIDYISHIPLNERTDSKTGKKPLREIARKIGVPDSILTRSKMGQLDMGTINEDKYH